MAKPNHSSIALIGCVGIPNRYGGFESFAENMAPVLAARGHCVTVTCDKSKYSDDLSPTYHGAKRLFLTVPANGSWSPIHDLLAFLQVLPTSRIIIVLGVSAGVFFPLMRLVCSLRRSRLAVNIDGVEWRRSKFGICRRAFLFLSDWLAQRSAHVVIYDNAALLSYVRFPYKSRCVEYSGDHANAALPDQEPDPALNGGPYALAICRIEPENNCELLLDGFLSSSLSAFVFVGNWEASAYGRSLRARYGDKTRLKLLDAIYDGNKIRALRSGCSHYLHGHSVGGTNPSLVEILFFDCLIYCFDCSFNRATAGDVASYFASAMSLSEQLNSSKKETPCDREDVRARFSAPVIARKLTDAVGAVTRSP